MLCIEDWWLGDTEVISDEFKFAGCPQIFSGAEGNDTAEDECGCEAI